MQRILQAKTKWHQHEFWLFSFEHYNGILGNQPTNNRFIEPQLMQRFLGNNCEYAFNFPEEFSDIFAPLCQTQCRVTGSVHDSLSEYCESPVYELPTKSKFGTFNAADLGLLKNLL